MDSFANSQNASSSKIVPTLSRKRKADDQDSIMVVPSKRARFCQTNRGKVSMTVISKRTKFLQTYRRQAFTLPDSIMHYIAKNPSSAKLYAKLVQTCKYFFIKNPVLIISDLFYDDRNGWEATYNGNSKGNDTINTTSKLWLTDKILVFSANNNCISSLLTKIFKCEITNLILFFQHLSYNELLVIASNVEKVCLNQVIVKNQDGTFVPFEKIVKAFPRAENVRFVAPSSVSTITSKTFTELLKIPHFLKLNSCELENIPEAFDLESFYFYMKENKHTRFCLGFSKNCSDVYKSRIEKIVNEILGTPNHNYKPPLLHFSGLNIFKRVQLSAMQH